MKPLKASRRACLKMPAGMFSFLNGFSRYAVYEYEHQIQEGSTSRTQSKILFILYAPDICDSKEKFLYATSKDDLKKKVQPFNKELQVNDWADLDEEAWLKVLKF